MACGGVGVRSRRRRSGEKWTHILIETERGRGAAHRPRVAHQLLGQGKLGGEAASATDAAEAVFFPISGFVAMGLDHSVANMFLIPFGIFCGAEITWADMVMKNLVPVTLGNLVGGAVFVAAAYHSAYGK